MRLKAKSLSGASAYAIWVLLFSPTAAQAQDATPAAPAQAPATNSAESKTQDIVVTGSRIRTRSAASVGSSVDVLDAKALAQSAPTGNIVDVLRLIPQNFGNQGQFDGQGGALEGIFGAGTLDLRGFGGGATLTLLNGRRQVPIPTDSDSRVDVNSLLPSIMIERVEVLKDGGSALYGSDAVSGVVNFFSRSKFDGIELRASGQGSLGQTPKAFDFNNQTFGAIVGTHSADDRFHMVIAGEYHRQTPFYIGWTDAPVFTASGSSFGFPGSFLVPQANGTTLRVPDPSCQSVAAQNIHNDPIFDRTQTALINPTTCGLRQPLNALQVAIKRVNVRAEASYKLADWITAELALGYVSSESSFVISPTAPLLTNLVVPANNPGNIFGRNVLFVGRPYSDTNLSMPKQNNPSDVRRFEFGLKGDLRPLWSGGEDWAWDLAYTYSDYKATRALYDTYLPGLQAALNGRGGQCGCLFFNPFGSSLTAAPGSPLYNDPSLVNFIQVLINQRYKSTLSTVDGTITGSPFNLPAGPLGVALGFQVRREGLAIDFDSLDTLGVLGFYGNRDQDFAKKQTVLAGFMELAIPLYSGDLGKLDFSAAGRVEGRTSASASFNPKLSLLYSKDWLKINGSWGKSTQSPSLFQTGGGSYSNNIIVDPVTGGIPLQTAQRTVGNADLEDQQSTAYSVGATISPSRRFSVGVTYWHYDFSKLIAAPAGQAIVNANPFDPRIVRGADNTIQIINLPFFNAGSIKASGLDIEGHASFPTDKLGVFSAGLNATRVLTYDLQTLKNGPVRSGLGSDNSASIGRSMPKWRGSARLGWNIGRFDTAFSANYYSGITAMDPATLPVKSFVRFDLETAVALPRPNMVITVGALNLFNAMPNIISNSGFFYNQTLQDPRGRIVYASIKYKLR